MGCLLVLESRDVSHDVCTGWIPVWGKHVETGYQNYCSWRSEISPAVEDVGERRCCVSPTSLIW